MDPLTCWQLPQTLRELQRMQQGLNSENFLWPSCGTDLRLNIKQITGRDKFLSLHPYTVSIQALVSASTRSTALLPNLPHVGLFTSSWQHLKFPPISVDGGTDDLEGCSKHIKRLPDDISQLNAENWSEDETTNKTSLKHWSLADRPIPCNGQAKESLFFFYFGPAFLPQWCRTPGQRYLKSSSPSEKHWEKVSKVVVQSGESQVLPGRPAWIT